MLSASVFLLTLILIAFILTRVLNFTLAICVALVLLTGTITATGILAGFTSVEISTFWKIAILFGFFILVVLLSQRLQSSKSPESSIPFLLPLIFFFSIFCLFFLVRTQPFSFLLNHWDGSTNSGMVVALNQFQQINTLPKLTGVQTYPVGMHYTASWFVNLASRSGDSITTVNTFIGFYTTLYVILILQVGYLAFLLSKALHFSKILQVTATSFSQLIMIAPFIVESIFLVFSLAFLGAIVATLTSLICIHEIQESNCLTSFKIALVTTGFSFLIVASSYPLLLPTIGSLFLFLIFKCRSHKIRVTNSLPKALLFFVPLPISIGLVYLYGIMPSISPRFRFNLTGDFSTMRVEFVFLTVLLPLSLLLYIKRINRKYLALYTFFYVAVIGTVAYAWVTSGSWNRGYGVNYYAKKSEFMMFLLFTSLFVTAVFSLLNFLMTLKRFRQAMQAISLIVLTLTSLHFIYNGIFKLTIEPALRNDDLNSLMSAAVTAANVPGRSIVWSSSLPAKSIHASLLSNYLDKSNYLEPDYLNLNLVLAQQLSVFDWNQPPESACSFLGQLQSGKSEIYLVDQNMRITCE